MMKPAKKKSSTNQSAAKAKGAATPITMTCCPESVMERSTANEFVTNVANCRSRLLVCGVAPFGRNCCELISVTGNSHRSRVCSVISHAVRTLGCEMIVVHVSVRPRAANLAASPGSVQFGRLHRSRCFAGIDSVVGRQRL